MPDEPRNPSPDKKPAKGKARRRALPVKGAGDISKILRDWPHQAGSVNARWIVCKDGRRKVQMRVELGLLQMELNDRPDGKRPHGYSSLLQYVETRLGEHIATEGDEEGFALSPRQCAALRDEAMQIYHRYLTFFVLEHWEWALRDTERNLRVLDLCSRYAVNEGDRLAMEQYRPYILMMRARAQAAMDLHENEPAKALASIEGGLAGIRDFFTKFDREESFDHCGEAHMLRHIAKEIRQRLPVDPVERLNKRLARAIQSERYELAAQLRDEIERLQNPDRRGVKSVGKK